MQDIALSSVRVIPECLARWQHGTDNCFYQLADGEIRARDGEVGADILDDGRLRVVCAVSRALVICVTADPHEWSIESQPEGRQRRGRSETLTLDRKDPLTVV